MPSIAVSLTPVDRARRRVELPVISAADSPSRNPCKVRQDTIAGRSFRNEPYRFKALSNSPGATPPRPGIPMGSLIAPSNNKPTQDPSLLPPVAPTGPGGAGSPPRRAVGLMGALEQPSPPPQAPNDEPITHDEEVAMVTSPTSTTGSVPPPPPAAIGDITPPRGGGGSTILSDDGSPVASPPRESKFGVREGSTPPVDNRANTPPPKRPAAVIIKFKHQDGVFLLPTEEEYAPSFDHGDYVVVEGDRGEHVGRIDQMNIHHRHSTNSVGRVIRKAYADEIALVQQIRTQEPRVTRQVQHLAEAMDVAMRVIDTEIQTDRNKLTIYYVTNVGGPVDFRQLQRRLFKEFRCRIWFVDWDTL